MAPAYLFPFACFSCRRSFKRHRSETQTAVCPSCGAEAVQLDRKFKAPRRNDLAQWEKVRFLYAHGFRFATQYEESGRMVRYPATLEEARTFVAIYKPRWGRR